MRPPSLCSGHRIYFSFFFLCSDPICITEFHFLTLALFLSATIRYKDTTNGESILTERSAASFSVLLSVGPSRKEISLSVVLNLPILFINSVQTGREVVYSSSVAFGGNIAVKGLNASILFAIFPK